MSASIISSTERTLVVLVAVAYFSIACQCKSINGRLRERTRDPLLAMASEPRVQHITYSHVLQPQGEVSQYSIVQSQPSGPMYEQQRGEQPQRQVEVGQQRIVLRPGVQLVQASEQNYHDSNCNHNHQQAAPEQGRDYPGEILYIGQNNEILGTGPAAGNGASPQIQSGAHGTPELNGVASAISRSSGVPATILTEIPVNEMPGDVLEKLRKDYGVKVVATRERPGANLVINCDDYSSHESSICSRQPEVSHQMMGAISPYAYGAPQEEYRAYPMAEQAPQPHEPQPDQHVTYAAGAEPGHEVVYTTSQADEQQQLQLQQQQPQEQQQQQAPQEEAYVAGGPDHVSSSTGEAAVVAAANRSQQQAAEQQQQVGENQTEQNLSSHQTIEQSEQQNVGFDEQPKSVEEETKQSGGYYVNQQ